MLEKDENLCEEEKGNDRIPPQEMKDKDVIPSLKEEGVEQISATKTNSRQGVHSV